MVSGSFFYLTIIISIWWFGSLACAIYSQRLLQETDEMYFFVELSFIQTLAGTIFAYAFLPCSGDQHPECFSPSTAQALKDEYFALIGPTIFHFLGVFSTNVCYGLLGSTFTFVIKMAEPAFTIILKKVILGESTSSRSITGVVLILSGILLLAFQSNSVKMDTFFPFLLSSCAFPVRNVLLKKDQKRALSRSPTERFLFLNAFAVPIASFVFTIKCVFSGSFNFFQSAGLNLTALAKVVVAYIVYQQASMIVLGRMDSVGHSLANAMKRVFQIYMSIYLLGETLSGKKFAASVILCAGIALYSLDESILRSFRTRKNLAISGLLALASLTVMAFLSFKLTIGNFIWTGRSSTSFSPVQLSPSRPSEKLVILHKPYIPLQTSFSNYDDTLLLMREQRLNANSGNLVWHLAASRLINASAVKSCIAPCSNVSPRELTASTTIMYWPTANLLSYHEAHQQKGRSLSKDPRKYVVIGIGTQPLFYRNGSNDVLRGINPGLEPDATVEDYELGDGIMSFLRKLSNDNFPLFLRGGFTLNVLRRHGFLTGQSVGCPSLFLNTRKDMGKRLERKYAALRKNIDSIRKVAIAINKSNAVLEFAMKIYDKYPESVFFVQTKSDLLKLRARGVPFNKTRLFYSVEDWQASICQFDAYVGVRIHGAMAALSCHDPVPVLLIAPDQRVKELAEVMHVPHMPSYHRALFNFSGNLHDILPDFHVSGRTFDDNRCHIAKLYKGAFENVGLLVNTPVSDLASTC